jgi:hypothetical protein
MVNGDVFNARFYRLKLSFCLSRIRASLSTVASIEASRTRTRWARQGVATRWPSHDIGHCVAEVDRGNGNSGALNRNIKTAVSLNCPRIRTHAGMS